MLPPELPPPFERALPPERLARVPVLREPVAFLADARVAPVLALVAEARLAVPEDLVRLDVPDFFLAALVRVEDLALERVLLDLAPADALRALPEPEEDLLPLPPDAASLHLPESTRCAASATASAMIEPSRVALDIMLVAAVDAVSAASRPASRILRRAAGLALIAAAAAARPAASISLLIAALAILSTVLSLLLRDDPDEDFDEPLLEFFAIASLPRSTSKTLEGRNGSQTSGEVRRLAHEIPRYVKGHRCAAAMPFDMVSGRK